MPERSSPIPSPCKSTRSPVLKSQRRLRTGTEGRRQLAKPAIQLPAPTHQHNFHSKGLTRSDFVTNAEERKKRRDPFFFFINTIGDTQGLCDSLIVSVCNISSVRRFTSSRCARWIRLGTWRTSGFNPVSIMCMGRSVRPMSSWPSSANMLE